MRIDHKSIEYLLSSREGTGTGRDDSEDEIAGPTKKWRVGSMATDRTWGVTSIRLLLIGCLLLGCDEKQAPKEKRTEPWPAPAVASKKASLERGAQLEYALEPGQKIEFELSTKSNTIAGVFPIVRGSLRIDPMQLTQSDSKLSIDLGAVRITSGSDKENPGYSITAQNWLNVGASLPEATRERRRWATFLLEEVTDSKVTSAHEAPLDRGAMKAFERAGADAAADASAADAAPTALDVPAEIRSTRARVLGSLEMNNRRIVQPYDVELQFLYPARATPGLAPETIVVNSTHKVRIPLAQYEIQPRNAAGVLVASELKLLGQEVGRVARLKFSLHFKSQARDPEGDD